MIEKYCEFYPNLELKTFIIDIENANRKLWNFNWLLENEGHDNLKKWKLYSFDV